jgi:hypothetical protein
MTELKPCGACGITGIHACLGPPIVTNDLMLIQTLTKRIAGLEKERAHTENNLASLQSTFEDIEAVFCDEDGCLIIEPFNGEGLSRWFKANNLEQQAKALQFALENITNPELIYNRLKALKEKP